MSVISLQCPNCNAKLKAKSSAVGQSLACPRCANMLVVSDPAETKSKSDRPLRSFESDSLDELLDQPNLSADATDTSRQATPKPKHPEDFQATMPAQSASQFSDLESTPNQSKARKQSSPKTQTAAAKSPDADGPQADHSKMGPAAWQSQKAKKRQAVLLGVILGVGVLLIGGALTFYFLNRPAVTADKTSGNDGKELVTNDSDGPTLESSDPNRGPDNPADSTENTNDDGKGPGASTDANDSSANVPVVEPGTPEPNPEGVPDLVEPATPGTTITTESPAGDDQNTGADPESAEDRKQDAGQRRESFEDAINQIFNGDAVFQEQALTGPEASNDISNSPFGEVLIAEGGLQRRRSARYERPAERLVDVAEQLTTEIAGIKNDAMQPLRLIQVMERLSSVPIWIDRDAFQASPIDLNQEVAVQSIKQSVADVLAEHLDAFQLTYEVTEFGVRVIPNGSGENQTVRYATPGLELSAPRVDQQNAAEADDEEAEDALEDGPLGNVQPAAEVVANETEKEVDTNSLSNEIAIVIRQFVHNGAWQDPSVASEEDQSPARWLQVEGDSLIVDGPAETQFRVKRLLDQLTAVQTAMPNESDSLLRPLAFGCEKELAKLIRLDYYSPTPLRVLLAGFANETGIKVIIDWPALIKEGWTPDTEVPWIVDNLTAKKAIDELTFDMGLSYQVVTPGVLVLTSADSVNQNMDVEVYAVGDLLAGLDQWPLLRSRLSQMLYVEFKQYPNAYLNYYADWDCVIAKLPQGGHQRLTDYFSQLRSIIQENNLAD